MANALEFMFIKRPATVLFPNHEILERRKICFQMDHAIYVWSNKVKKNVTEQMCLLEIVLQCNF